jgi:hypothetical protein
LPWPHSACDDYADIVEPSGTCATEDLQSPDQVIEALVHMYEAESEQNPRIAEIKSAPQILWRRFPGWWPRARVRDHYGLTVWYPSYPDKRSVRSVRMYNHLFTACNQPAIDHAARRPKQCSIASYLMQSSNYRHCNVMAKCTQPP